MKVMIGLLQNFGRELALLCLGSFLLGCKQPAQMQAPPLPVVTVAKPVVKEIVEWFTSRRRLKQLFRSISGRGSPVTLTKFRSKGCVATLQSSRIMEPTGFNHHGPDHSGPSSRVALPSARMTTEEVLKALGRYTEESRESDRQTATKLGVNRMTLTAWLGGRDLPQRCMLARLAGFLRRVGYL
jgi:hypothetical protein